MSSNKESIQRTLLVAFLVCLVCSVLVASVAVMLRPTQVMNRLLDTQRSIVNVAGMDAKAMSASEIQGLFGTRIVAKLVELKTGQYSTAKDPVTFNPITAAKDPATSTQLDASEDIASIQRIEKYTTVYLVNDEQGELQSIVLPIRGYGLWGTLYGFMAIASDLNTVKGLAFHDHKETPGLGGEVDNPKWKATWVGKKVYDDENHVALSVSKGSLKADDPQAIYKIDALAGATLTSKGVNNLVHFWMGEHGFGPYIANLRSGEL